ncbi:MAG TPA: heavy metal translocating P-type ATPase [Candidatus Onthovivens sp.]|nr:heavy metal translocating P-type ATPase [Candidatus Onthovivens sp.]
MSKKLNYWRIGVIAILTIFLLVFHLVYGETKLGISDVNTLIILPISLVSYAFLSYDLYIKSYHALRNKEFFNEITLMIIATIAAFIIREYVEALAVVIFYQIGQSFESYALNKSRNNISSILNLKPDTATLYNDDIEKIIDPEDVEIGDYLLVKNGERVPLDGIVISGSSFLDTSSLTGESIPVSIKEDDEILSGVINLGSPLIIKVTKNFYNSTLGKILDLVENATNKKTKSEKFISKFSKIYTPIVILLALLVFIISPLTSDPSLTINWSNSAYYAASILVIACPCSLVLSVPMAYFIGLGEASKLKVLIKGSEYLERLNRLDTIVLDKTGTITKGDFKIVDSYPYNISKESLLEFAQIGESFSTHPIKNAIIDSKIEINTAEIKDFKTIEGKGTYCLYKGKELLTGNKSLLEAYNIEFKENNDIGTIIYLSYDSKFLGSIVIADQIKEDSAKAITNFYKNGIKNIYMFTGDKKEIAEDVARKVNIKNVYSSLLPIDKTNRLEEIINTSKNKHIAFIGDGVNDAPSLILSPIGISMGSIGTDAAIEAGDIVILDDNLNKINEAKKISRKTINVVYQNIIISLLIKITVLVLTSLGILGDYAMWFAIFADVGVTFLAVLNSLRIMKK